MNLINILLIGKDMQYCKALSESLAELSKEMMITLCDQSAITLLNSDNHTLLLVEGNLSVEKLQGNLGVKKLQGNDNCILLVESKQEEIIDIENKIFCLYKYENVKEIIRMLFTIYNSLTGKSVTTIGDNNSKIISVFSGYGGSGKTSISLGLAQEFVRFRGKKVLYINYEECEGTWNYMDFQSENKYDSIGNYLYYLNKGIEIDLKAFLKQDVYGVSYFKPSLGRNQLKGLCTEDLCKFTNKLIATNQFEYIIFDCHICLDESTLWLLKNSCWIVYLAENTHNANFDSCAIKDIGIIKYIESKFNGSIAEKLIKVYNKVQVEDIETNIEEFVIIGMDPGSFQIQNELIKINIEREFGEGIKSIADRIEDD